MQESGTSHAGLRMLAVHAHPDDESSKGAATTARYTRLGARVMIATLTGGEAGDILNPALENSPQAVRDIAALRRDEMAAAASVLGAEQRWVGYVDSGLPEGDFESQTPHGSFYHVPDEVAARPLVHILRNFRPHVVTTYDELGGYPHPDHIKTHFVTMAAVAAAADPQANPELGEAWEVQKVYFNQDLAPRKWLMINDLMIADGLDDPLGDMPQRYLERDALRDTWLTAAVECAEYFPLRDEALRSHATQIDPNGGFFFGTRALAQKYWTTEEFELALDRTGRALDRSQAFVESDLFAGVLADDGTRVPEDLLGAPTPVTDTRSAAAGEQVAE